MTKPSAFLPAIAPAETRLRWYIVYTNPRRERCAALCLRGRGYTTFLPMRTRWVKEWRRRVKADTPLFPRYLFFGVGPGQALWGLQHAAGVQGVLRNGDVPLEAPRKVVDEIWRACAVGRFDETRTGASGPAFDPGDEVEVIAGPWASLPAVVERHLSPQTVEVVLRLFAREVGVRVSVDSLRKAC